MHVGEPVVTPLEAEGQPLVVDAQLVERRGLKIVNMDRILDDVVAELVGTPVTHAPRMPAPAIQTEKHRGDGHARSPSP